MTTLFRVALTFDVEHSEGESLPDATDRIFDTLGSAGIRATAFLQGRWVRAHPTTARRIASDGHLVGHHSHHHARFAYLTRAGIRHDLAVAEAVIRDVAGVDPRPWFRLPFGSGARSTRVHAALAALGYRHVHWNVDTLDWATGKPRMVCRLAVSGAIAHGDGAIVLMHGWPRRTVAALPEIVERLRDAGATFVTVDELLEA